MGFPSIGSFQVQAAAVEAGQASSGNLGADFQPFVEQDRISKLGQIRDFIVDSAKSFGELQSEFSSFRPANTTDIGAPPQIGGISFGVDQADTNRPGLFGSVSATPFVIGGAILLGLFLIMRRR